MSLTLGHGPLAGEPAGERNYRIEGPQHRIWFEPSPRRVRGVFGGEAVVDSRGAHLLHETGHLPVYYFPREDVRSDLLQASDTTSWCPFKGEASYWTLRAGGREAADAVWGYPDPLDTAPPIGEFVAFYWDVLDAWYEEDEEVFAHPRDPYHRVDALAASCHVRVSVEGRTVADSRQPVLLFETGLPTRYYLPREDVDSDLLVPSETTSRCPYKGKAWYCGVEADGKLHEDLVWTYPEPEPAVEKIAGRLAFFDEKVDVEVDGEPQERPRTKWS